MWWTRLLIVPTTTSQPSLDDLPRATPLASDEMPEEARSMIEQPSHACEHWDGDVAFGLRARVPAIFDDAVATQRDPRCPGMREVDSGVAHVAKLRSLASLNERMQALHNRLAIAPLGRLFTGRSSQHRLRTMAWTLSDGQGDGPHGVLAAASQERRLAGLPMMGTPSLPCASPVAPQEDRAASRARCLRFRSAAIARFRATRSSGDGARAATSRPTSMIPACGRPFRATSA